jgi:hypothetical protein
MALATEPSQTFFNRPGSKWTMDLTLDGCIDGSRLDGTRNTLVNGDQIAGNPKVYGKETYLRITDSDDSRVTTREVKK